MRRQTTRPGMGVGVGAGAGVSLGERRGKEEKGGRLMRASLASSVRMGDLLAAWKHSTGSSEVSKRSMFEKYPEECRGLIARPSGSHMRSMGRLSPIPRRRSGTRSLLFEPPMKLSGSKSYFILFYFNMISLFPLPSLEHGGRGSMLPGRTVACEWRVV